MYTNIISIYQHQIQEFDSIYQQQKQEHDREVFDYRSGNFTVIALMYPASQGGQYVWGIRIFNDPPLTPEQHVTKCIHSGFIDYLGHNRMQPGHYPYLIAYIFTRNAEDTVAQLHAIFARCRICDHSAGYRLGATQTIDVLRSNNIPFIHGW